MKIAACSSITSARRARLMSMPINSRSTATVESRSSPNAMARSVSLEKLRAQARGDGERARGVGFERRALDGLDPGREPAVGIGYCDPDGLGAQIEPDQRAA